MTPTARRLGVYCDGPFRLVERDGRTLVAPDHADFPFLTFACHVGLAFESIVLFARARPGDADDPGPFLPDSVQVARLPFFASLAKIGGVVRAVPGTATGFWRGLARVDTIWVFGPHPLAFLLVPLALVRRKRVVLGVRQDTVAYFRSRLPSGRWRPTLALARLWDRGFRLFARHLDTVVVGDELAQHYGGHRRGLLVTTVSLVRTADVVDAPCERDWTGEIRLLTVGRIDVEKNPWLLVDAMAELERRQPGQYLLDWIGAGPLEEELAGRLATQGVADRVELLGFVPFGPALLERYRRAHLFVHVSLTEGVPATLVEALASGTPVVATDVGGVGTALEGGRAGVLVPPADLDALVEAIMRVSDEPALRDELTRVGLELAKKHTLDAEAARIATFVVDRDR